MSHSTSSAKQSEAAWIHILLRGDKLDQNDKYLELFKQTGWHCVALPILRFQPTNIQQLADQMRQLVESTNPFGLILTSQRAVDSIDLALAELSQQDRYKFRAKIQRDLTFVVGTKTGQHLESSLGIKYNRSSADSGSSSALVDFMRNSIKDERVTLLLPKSSLSNQLIEEAEFDQHQAICIKPVIAYETSHREDLSGALIGALEGLLGATISTELTLNLIFFSPSGVDAYLKEDEKAIRDFLSARYSCKSAKIVYSCIGRTTQAALLDRGHKILCVPQKPDPESLRTSIMDAMRTDAIEEPMD